MATTSNGWEAIPAYGDARLATLPQIAGSGNVLGGDVERVFSRFLDAYAAEVAPINKGDSWGFAPRTIHGSTTLSNHASGTAVDINSTSHPQFKSTYTDAQKRAVRALLARYPVIRWGGDYPAARLDEMHFEINATPPQVAAFVKGLGSTGGGTTVSSKMVSPAEGRVSSEYGNRTLNGKKSLHAGIDISGSGASKPVYAAFAGTVEKVVRGRKHGQAASSGTVLAPGRSGNGVLIRNPDGERQLYGHVGVVSGLKVGDKVTAGQHLGSTDLSGNTTGYHLHFETWGKNGATRNPRIYFGYHGVTPGSKPVTTSGPGKPVTPPASNAGVKRVQEILKGLGLYKGYLDGVNGPMTKASVRDYQQRQNTNGAAGLRVDGDWGSYTEAWYQWARAAQTALKAYRGVSGVVVDGDYGPAFARQVRLVQQRNRLYVDGVLGPVMVSWMRSTAGGRSPIPPRP